MKLRVYNPNRITYIKVLLSCPVPVNYKRSVFLLCHYAVVNKFIISGKARYKYIRNVV